MPFFQKHFREISRYLQSFGHHYQGFGNFFRQFISISSTFIWMLVITFGFETDLAIMAAGTHNRLLSHLQYSKQCS